MKFFIRIARALHRAVTGADFSAQYDAEEGIHVSRGTYDDELVQARRDGSALIDERLALTERMVRAGTNRVWPPAFRSSAAIIILEISADGSRGNTGTDWDLVKRAFYFNKERIQGGPNEVLRGVSPRDTALYRLRYWAEPQNQRNLLENASLAAQLAAMRHVYATALVIPGGLFGVILDLVEEIRCS
ncbi:MAG: hypothetical protein V7704_15045 [Aurantimonas endophytica]|uniref:hypothetical protein n=1 Tax=Aurantimonas endophytica TaxID=1522175 RepID=UPI00300207DB